MESQATLVRAQGRVELDAVSAVHAKLSIVIFPDDAELDGALGDGADLQGGAILGVLLKESAVFEGTGKFCGSRRHRRR